MHIIFRWILNALALLLVAYLLPGFAVDSFYAALITALILGILNAVIRPLLIILTLPVTILTLGLFTFVINALLIWFVASFVQGFQVDGFGPAFLAGLLLWIISWFTNGLTKKRNTKPKVEVLGQPK
ncbi:MAG: phage holin family protein [Candidatus Nomurabacteria bacterium]|nr:MAG: phage holin family protein [Candidatus Nomurabacteria bacterium]